MAYCSGVSQSSHGQGEARPGGRQSRSDATQSALFVQNATQRSGVVLNPCSSHLPVSSALIRLSAGLMLAFRYSSLAPSQGGKSQTQVCVLSSARSSSGSLSITVWIHPTHIFLIGPCAAPVPFCPSWRVSLMLVSVSHNGQVQEPHRQQPVLQGTPQRYQEGEDQQVPFLQERTLGSHTRAQLTTATDGSQVLAQLAVRQGGQQEARATKVGVVVWTSLYQPKPRL